MEEEKLLDLQELVILERENFVRFIFNGSWNSVVHRNNIDTKLLNYEQTVAVAATSGIDMETKDVIYKWSYIQAVFFTSTILTTIGKNILSHFVCLFDATAKSRRAPRKELCQSPTIAPEVS